MSSFITIYLKRETTDQSWGFCLQGGSNYSIPLSIQLVNPNTLAYRNGLNTGDYVISINGRNVTNVTYEEAKMEITRSGNELEITIIKPAINQQSVRAARSLSYTKVGSVHPKSVSQIIKPHFSNGSNREITSWNARNGAKIISQVVQSNNCRSNNYTQKTVGPLRSRVPSYESLAAYNRDSYQQEIWKPNTYHDNSQVPGRHIATAVYHAQYNSPIGLYSDDKVLEAFKAQTGDLFDKIKGNNSVQSSVNNNNETFCNQLSPTYQAVMNNEQRKSIHYSLKGKFSGSLQSLKQDIYSVQNIRNSIYDQQQL
ncbi:unnamed protein product [Adineta steineri]|uniref:PDZ domain-containing protein n=1 Tax=Adineta steineri TaxID=433720 RepID=A0A818J9R8_9BILA|nr:unnamed protein product [Adineta steineri]